MNKVKMFFIAAALVLTTAGVFAGKARFINSDLYASNGVSTFHLDNASTFFNLTTTQPSGGVIAKISSSTTPSNTYGVYTFNGSSLVALYTSGF